MLSEVADFIQNSLELYRNVRILDQAEYPAYGSVDFSFVAEGEMTIEGQSVTVQIALDNRFPLHKPFFFIKPYSALGFIPHVDRSGFICYMHDEGLIINSNSMTAIIEESFNRVLKTLCDGVTGNNHEDVQDEFEAYWTNQDNIVRIESNFEVTNNVKRVVVCRFENYPRYFVGDNITDVMNYCYKYIGKERMGKPTFGKALYIPLREGAKVKPPYYGAFWSVHQIRKLLYDNVTGANKRAIESISKQKIKHNTEMYILISIPLTNGNRTLVGIKFSEFYATNKKNSRRDKAFNHPLNKRGNMKCTMVPVSISRHDMGYIMPRGGGNNALSSKRIAVIGCGSVGGNIAIEIAKAGVRDISLIDQDYLVPENTYRHILGVNSLLPETFKDNKSSCNELNLKIVGLKRDIEQKLPYTRIEALSTYGRRVEDIIDQNSVDFRKYDLVVVAMGNPTIELYLNSIFQSTEGLPPILFTWLEAYGVGGHAILTNNNKMNGCLHCLYSDPFEPERALYNRAAFAAEGQFFAKQIAGCGSVYMPYSSLDSVQTAIIASRLAIDVLTGKERDNPIISWKGNADLLIQNGYKLSDHYSLSGDALFNSRYMYKKRSCEKCGHKKDVNNG